MKELITIHCIMSTGYKVEETVLKSVADEYNVTDGDTIEVSLCCTIMAKSLKLRFPEHWEAVKHVFPNIDKY